MNDEKKVTKITSRSENFAEWYTDIIKQTHMMMYSNVKGMMIFEPFGYEIWENIMNYLDKKFKDTGHKNVYMPSLIPESLINLEKQHVEGFTPELLWVTKGGNEDLVEKMCIRPTSETLFCGYFKDTVKSYRDLPKLLNQWCNVIRWEKSTKPFLRNTEFLWQEGHTVHRTEEEALEETKRMHDIYIEFCEKILLIPVISGKKTEKEKFAGAVSTYTVESLMQDGRALQCATSHYLGENFAKVFDITYLDENNKLVYVKQTSWGISTRIIGALIMTHGDDKGLKLPPKIAPIQIVIIPIMPKTEIKDLIIKKSEEIIGKLNKKFRVKFDDSNKGIGFKYSEYEMLGVPIRIEIGQRDLEKNQITIVRRDNGSKKFISLDLDVCSEVEKIIDEIELSMFNERKEYLNNNTYLIDDYAEFKKTIKNGGIMKTSWCGGLSCEIKIKEETSATSRCVSDGNGKCIVCGKNSEHKVCWAISY